MKQRYVGRGREPPGPLQAHHLLQTLMCSPTWKLSNPVLWDFYGDFYNSMIEEVIGHWQLILPAARLRFLEVGGLGLKVPTL